MTTLMEGRVFNFRGELIQTFNVIHDSRVDSEDAVLVELFSYRNNNLIDMETMCMDKVSKWLNDRRDW